MQSEIQPETQPSPRPRRDAAMQFARMARDYWNSERKWTVRGAVLSLVVLTAAQVGLVIWVSYWHRELFDALENRALDERFHLVLTFVLICALTMGVTAVDMHVKRWVQLDWRRWMTSLLLDEWLSHANHYRLQFSSGEHDNPDGRIAEDIRIATEAAVGLAQQAAALNLLGAPNSPIKDLLRGITRQLNVAVPPQGWVRPGGQPRATPAAGQPAQPAVSRASVTISSRDSRKGSRPCALSHLVLAP